MSGNFRRGVANAQLKLSAHPRQSHSREAVFTKKILRRRDDMDHSLLKRIGKRKFNGAQRQALAAFGNRRRRSSIQRISLDGTAGVGEVDADLMRAAGGGTGFDERGRG